MFHQPPFRKALFAGTLAVCATPLAANEFAPAMQGYFETELSVWVQDPMLVAAIEANNALTGGLSQAEIDALDQQWRAEVGSSNTPTITPVLEGEVAAHLREIVERSGHAVTEIILMDAQGLNVAVSAVTSDMWQGDEAKHQETYGVGAGAVHISDVEFDESTQTYQGQISVAISDPATGDVVGAITFGVNVDALM